MVLLRCVSAAAWARQDCSRYSDSDLPVNRWRPMLSLVVSAVALCGSQASAGNATPDRVSLARLDGYTMALTDRGSFSGVVLVARNGKVVFEKAYGPRDPLADALATTQTRYNLASAGKMFTATAILQLVDNGKLSLDSTVGSLLAGYPNRKIAANVTVRHLLTHMGGTGDVDLFGTENAKNRSRIKTVSEMLALHDQRAPEFEPGSQQQYGNFGHVILGRIIELVSGETYEDYVRNHIFVPAKMNSTGFVNCSDSSENTAIGYVQLEGKMVSNCATLPARGFPAGGQLSTGRDMLRFVEALRKGILLKPKTFALAIKSQHQFMGLGFFATGYGPDVPARDFRWGHGGSADGICTDVRTYPETGETIIVLSNRDAPTCYDVSNFLHRIWNDPHNRSNRRNSHR
jgi:D-alanyl-D-alanine carboxypeptidase